MNKIAQTMAELFETEPELEVDYSVREEQPTVSFEEKCKDISAVMEHEEDIPNLPLSLDAQEIMEGEITPREPVLSTEARKSTEKGIEQASKGQISEGPDIEADKELAGACSDNPLALDGSDLKAYREIKERYPHFNLYDGSQSFRDFYTSKLNILKDLLSRHPVLPLTEMKKELDDIKTDHYVGESYASPMILRKKLDESYMWRTRLLSMLMAAHSQYPSWHRMLELMHGKLWKDHDIKPAHRRDGLVTEHLHDIEVYVVALKGFIKSADYLDSILKAAAESLSRQIACISLKEATGFSQATQEDTVEEKEVIVEEKVTDNPLDNLDGVEGVIYAPKEENKTVDYGVSSDDFSGLGL